MDSEVWAPLPAWASLAVEWDLHLALEAEVTGLARAILNQLAAVPVRCRSGSRTLRKVPAEVPPQSFLA
jgi:hypothetical protein